IASMDHGGEVVAIVPRSFCNGTYFKPFRSWLLDRVAVHRIHLFESRRNPFGEDDVLQENIILHMERGGSQGEVVVSGSHDQYFHDFHEWRVPFTEVVLPSDEEKFIRVPDVVRAERSSLFIHRLEELGLTVSTGPVVDFRVREHTHSHIRNGIA